MIANTVLKSFITHFDAFDWASNYVSQFYDDIYSIEIKPIVKGSVTKWRVAISLNYDFEVDDVY